MNSDVPTAADQPAGARIGTVIALVIVAFLIGAAVTVLFRSFMVLAALGAVRIVNGSDALGRKVVTIPISIVILVFTMLASRSLSALAGAAKSRAMARKARRRVIYLSCMGERS